MKPQFQYVLALKLGFMTFRPSRVLKARFHDVPAT